MDTTASEKGHGFVEILSRRRVVATLVFLAVVLLSIAAALLVRPYYSAMAHVLLVNDQQGRDPSNEGADMPEIATSTTVLDHVRGKLNLTLPIATLRKNVTVRVAPRSSIMTIAAKDHNAAAAVAITNAVADEFTTLYGSVSGGRYQKVIDQLRADLLARRTRILSLESRLQHAAADSSYVGSQSSLDNTASSMNLLVTQRTMAYSQLVGDRAELAGIRTQPGKMSKIVRHETLANDQAYRALEINVAHDAANLAVHKASYTDQFPGLAGEEDKMGGENAALRKTAQAAIGGPAAYSPSLAGQIVAEQKSASAVDGDVARVKALDDQIAQTKQALRDVPTTGMNVGGIRALRDAEEAQYQALSLRLSNAQANSAEANSLGSVVVIDRAENATQSLVGSDLLIALGFVLALALAAAAAYIAEFANPRFISPGDVESIYGRPVLGSINAF